MSNMLYVSCVFLQCLSNAQPLTEYILSELIQSRLCVLNVYYVHLYGFCLFFLVFCCFLFVVFFVIKDANSVCIMSHSVIRINYLVLLQKKVRTSP